MKLYNSLKTEVILETHCSLYGLSAQNDSALVVSALSPVSYSQLVVY